MLMSILFIFAILHRPDDSGKPGGNSVDATATTAPEPNSVDAPATTGAPEPKNYIGGTVHVGYWSYSINGFRWMPFLGSEYMVERPDAQFLVLDISARNDDKTASTLPPIKLVNDAGQVFSESSAGAMQQGFFGPLKELNPGVTSRGLVAFDVPQGTYQVLLPGGFSSDETAKVLLSEDPARSRPNPSNAESMVNQQPPVQKQADRAQQDPQSQIAPSSDPRVGSQPSSDGTDQNQVPSSNPQANTPASQPPPQVN